MSACQSAMVMLLGTALLGCRPDLTHELAAVESLFPVIEKVEKQISEIDTSVIYELAERVDFQCIRIKEDSIAMDEALAVSFDQHCGLSEIARQLLHRRKALEAEVLNTRFQLQGLRSDLVNRVAIKDSVSAFIEVEFLYVEHLGELIQELEAGMQMILMNESAFSPALDSLMMVTTAKFVE